MHVDLALTDDSGRHWKGTATLALAADTTKPPATPTGDAATIPDTAAATTIVVPGVHDTRPGAELAKAFPGVQYTRVFVGGVQTNHDDVARFIDRVFRACTDSWAAGLTPIVSFKLDVDQVMAGKWATALKALGQALDLAPRTIVTVWHEPEDDMTAARFVPYFTLARQQLKAGNADLPVMYAAMAYQWAPTTAGGSIAGRTDNTAAWASVVADVYGVDVYSGRSFKLGLTLPEHPGFRRWYDAVIAGTQRRWIVAERGFEASTSEYDLRAQTIDREADWLESTAPASGCVGYVYWNTPGTEGSTALSLDDKGTAAVRQLVARLAAA